MPKTAVVLVSRRVLHPKYRKYFTQRRKFHVHDPEGRARQGDLVEFMSCRPISKTKRWIVTE